MYTLYLDESKPSQNIPLYTVGGLIIEDDVLNNTVKPMLDAIKQDAFGNTTVSLHEYDIRTSKPPHFEAMADKSIRKQFWMSLDELFASFHFSLVSVTIETESYQKRYSCCEKNDEYFVGMQLILENFVYFLDGEDAKGKIVAENSDTFSDVRLRSHFFSLMNQGTLYLSKQSLQRRIDGFQIASKSENNCGLQLADFVPNAIKRHQHKMKPKSPSILPHLLKNVYDGGVNDRERFGLKFIRF